MVQGLGIKVQGSWTRVQCAATRLQCEEQIYIMGGACTFLGEASPPPSSPAFRVEAVCGVTLTIVYLLSIITN